MGSAGWRDRGGGRSAGLKSPGCVEGSCGALGAVPAIQSFGCWFLQCERCRLFFSWACSCASSSDASVMARVVEHISNAEVMREGLTQPYGKSRGRR